MASSLSLVEFPLTQWSPFAVREVRGAEFAVRASTFHSQLGGLPMWLKSRLTSSRKIMPIRNKQPRKTWLLVEALEARELLTVFTPGNLVVLQEGDGVTAYNSQAPLFLNEITQAGASVQQVTVPAVGGVGNPANQPITIDQSGAAGNGQLTRSYDGQSLAFGGIDSTINNGGLTLPETPSGTDDRVTAVLTGDPAIASNLNTTVHGQYYVGDDNRGAVLEGPAGPLYAVGHPNQAGAAVSQGVLYLPTFPPGGPTPGIQISASLNIRGGTIGFDNRLYFSTATGINGISGNPGGITTAAQPLPTGPALGTDIQVVPSIFTRSKVGGVWLADMNGTGVLSNGDRLYFVDDGTVGGPGSGGLYVSTWYDGVTVQNNPWNTDNANPATSNVAATAAYFVDHWTAPVRLGDAPVQTGSGGVGQLRGLTGTVISPTEAILYTSAFDNAGGDSSFIQKWDDKNNTVAIANAQITTGTTVQITTLTPNTFADGSTVEIDHVGTLTGVGALTQGYNGHWVIHVIDSTHFTYTDTNSGASGLAPVNNQGSAGNIVAGTIIVTQANGTNTIGGTAYANIGLRSVAFAPVAATTVTLTASATTVPPGTSVTYTATLSNPQVSSLSGSVEFIDVSTNTALGSAAIVGNQATFPFTFVGNHYIVAYFAGGGSKVLASAKSNTLFITEAGSTSSSTIAASNFANAAVGRAVAITATVSAGATGTVSFYNGSVSPANLIRTLPVVSNQAVLNTTFTTLGSNTIVAVYNGNDTFASSQGNVSVTIAANPTLSFTSSANNVALGATPTFTATVTGNATLGSPAGTVTFSLISATNYTAGAVTSPAIALSGSGTATTATWTPTAAQALTFPGSYFLTATYSATGATNPYQTAGVDTISAGNGTAFIENVKQPFTPGNLIVVQRGDGNTNLGSSGNLVFLDEYTTAGALVQRLALPNLDAGSAHALLQSGQNGGEGLLNRSANGQYLTVAGYDVPVGRTFVTSTFPYQFGRTIARADGQTNIDTSTVISTTAPVAVPYNPTDVVSNDGNEFWITSNLPTGDVTDSGILFASLGATSATQIGPANVGATAVAIAGGQLYATRGTGDIQAIGTGLPTTAGQALTSLPNLATAYAAAFATNRSPVQVLLLNTTTGTSVSPNVAYIADQAYGLLKFWFDGTNWNYGGPGGSFGQKLVFAGGTTGVIGNVVNPGTSAQIQLYVTGVNLQQQNPNQVDAFLDTHGGPIGSGALGIDQGFTAGNFTRLSYTGGTPGAAGIPTSPNGNMNFAGIAFAPGYTTATTITSTSNPVTAGTPVTFTATVTNPTTGTATPVTPSGTIIFTLDGVAQPAVLLNSSGVATFTPASTLSAGSHVVTAAYSGDVADNPSSQNFIQVVQSVAGKLFTGGDLVVSRVGTTGSLTGSATSTFLDQFTTAAGGTTGISLALATNTTLTSFPTAANVSGTTVTVTATNTFTAGQVVTVAGLNPAADNGTFTITSATGASFTYTNLNAVAGAATLSNASAIVTVAFTEPGSTFDNEGFLTDSADGHTLNIAGYGAVPGGNTASVNSEIGVITQSGSVDTSTQLPSSISPVRVTVSADGLGFWVASDGGVRYVPFANAATTPVQVTNQVRFPTAVGIFPYNPTATLGGQSEQLYASAGVGPQPNGTPALDSPFTIGSGLPTVAGQAIAVSPSFPTSRNANGNFPTTNQFAVSPDGNTIYFADGRTDGTGGIIKYFQSSPNVWTKISQLQIDSFGISTTSEGGTGGTVVTVTTSTPHNFTVGESVTISGVTPDGYNNGGNPVTITGVVGSTFTYSLQSAGLAPGSGGLATSNDGGLQALVADFSGANPVLYGTTTNTSGNRLVKLFDTGDLNGNAGSGFTATVLQTAGAGQSYRGVAFAPVAAGTTATTTTLAVSGSPAPYGSGVTLTATVTAGATGWVSFRAGGVEIGAAPVVNGATTTATFVTAGNLPAGSYSNLTAVYTGDSTHAPSTSSPASSAAIQQVTATPTLTIAANPVATGVSDTLTAILNAAGGVPVGTAPTGTVTFMDGTTVLNTTPATISQVIVKQAGNPVITFQASFKATFSTLGHHSITAVYSGDSNFTTATSAATDLLVVNPTTTAVTTDNASAGPVGATVDFTAAVTSPGAGTISGSVQFYDNLLPLGAPVTISGPSGVTAVETVSTALLQAANKLTPGLHSISAVYTPDAPGSLLFFTSTGVYEQSVKTLPFNAGDLFVYRVGDGTTSLIAQPPNPIAGIGPIGSTIYIDEYSPAGTLIQSIILPSADGTGAQNSIKGIVADGQQSPTGQLSLSGDKQYLYLEGYDNNPLNAATAKGLPNQNNNSVPRAVARIKWDGTIQTVAFTTGFSGVNTSGNINGVYSPDGNQFYISGFNGVYYSSSFAPSSALQSLVRISNPAFYSIVGMESDGTNLNLVGQPGNGGILVGAYSGFPTVATPIPSNLPGLPGADTFQQFPVDVFFTHLNGTGAPAGINTMYISDDGPGFANGQITKWALVGGTWTYVNDSVTAGTGNTAVSFYWMAGKTDASGNVTLYITYGGGGNANTGNGAVYSIVDTNGYNAPIGTGGTHSSAVTTVTSVSNTSLENFRGVAFAPTSPVASKFVITPSGSSVTAGNALLFTVQATDQFGNAVVNYSGPATATVTATPGDPLGNFPITVNLNSSGFGFGQATFKTVGSYTMTATAGALTGTSSSVTVTPAAANYFTVTAPSGAVTGVPTSTTVTAFDVFGNVATTFTGTVRLSSSDPAAVFPVNNYTFTTGTGGDNGVHTFSVTLNTAGNQTITANDPPPVITGTSPSFRVVGLQVSNFTVTPTGFTATFNKGFVPGDITQYGSSGTVQDVKLTTLQSGVQVAVPGTLFIDSTNTIITFKATGAGLVGLFGSPDPVLPNGSYTVTFVSGTGTGASANGFFDSLGVPLDGLSNGGHANYTTTFTLGGTGTGHLPSFQTQQILGIPDFARGPDGTHNINIPNDVGTGIPITFYNAAALTDATFTVTYNPAVLAITGTVTVGAPAGTSFALTSNTGGVATFHFSNATPQAGTVVLGDILANVPNSAASIYKTKELLSLNVLTVNLASSTAIVANGVHVNAYFGNTSGTLVNPVPANPRLGAVDIALANAVATGGATGFAAYNLLDPAIVGDVAGDFSVDSGDVSTIAAFVATIATPVIPTIPATITVTGIGADPTLSLTDAAQGPNSELVSVLLDHPHPVGSTGLTVADLALTYDPSVLSVSASDITLGTIPTQGTGWQISSYVDRSSGQIGIQLFSLTPITATQTGSLVNIVFHVSPGTSVPASAVHLVTAASVLADAQNQLVLGSGMDRLLVPTGVNPSAATPDSGERIVPVVIEHSAAASDRVPVSDAGATSVVEPAAVSVVADETDGLALVSNGAIVAPPQTQAAPTLLIIGGTLAFQSNPVVQLPGQTVAATNVRPVNSLLANVVQDQDWPTLLTTGFGDVQAGDGVGDRNDRAADARPEATDTAALDKAFAQIANESDTFDDFGAFRAIPPAAGVVLARVLTTRAAEHRFR
jgi:hypothetical protein